MHNIMEGERTPSENEELPMVKAVAGRIEMEQELGIVSETDYESSDKDEFPVTYAVSKMIRRTKKDVLVMSSDEEEENVVDDEVEAAQVVEAMDATKKRVYFKPTATDVFTPQYGEQSTMKKQAQPKIAMERTSNLDDSEPELDRDEEANLSMT